MTDDQLLILRNEELGTPTDLSTDAVRDISAALKALLADVFALYLGAGRTSIGTCRDRTSATITCCSTSSRTRFSQ